MHLNEIELVKQDSNCLCSLNPQPTATFSRFLPLAALELIFACVSNLLPLGF